MATSHTRASLLITIITVSRVAVSQGLGFECPSNITAFPGETTLGNFALPEPPVGRTGTVVCNPAPGSDVPAGSTEGNCTFTDGMDQVNNEVCFFDVDVVVEVEDVEDPPKWDIIVYPFIQVVPVDTPSGALIYQLKASDPEGTSVNFFLNSGGNGMFTVDEETGWIKTKLSSGQVYEQDKEYILSVYAEDRNGSRVNGEVTIFGGSHPPQFTKPRYQAKVVEERDANQSVIDVSAFSFNNNAGITYSILNNNNVNPRVPLHSIDASTGIITLTQRVDREELDSYFLNVQATEVGVEDPMSTVVRIEVEVTDINDCDPEFDRYTFTFKGIPETIDTNTLIGTVGASDCDIDPNNILIYSLTGADVSNFRITNSGELFADNRLNCDINDCIYQFKVKLEGQEKMADVLVYLTDVNDEPPVFLNADGYVYYVDEKAASGYKIGTVYANDADKNSTITFGIQGTTTFQIDPSTGVITRVGSGNLPEASYLFNVTAMDNGNLHTAYAEVTVQVNDINDNVPMFPNCQMYKPNISEAAVSGTFLIKVTATDADKGANAEIKYAIVGANVPFLIDQDTGEIFTQALLDREDKPTIDIVVEATDQPRNSYNNTQFCRFTVTINDVDDNAPNFPLSTYYVNLIETAPLFVSFLTVKAEDADESNQDLTYSLVDLNGAPFGMMSNGGIYPITSLVAFSGQTFNFKVRAEDGVNDGTSNVRVSITTGVAKPPEWTGVFLVATVNESALVQHVVETVSVVPGAEVVVITVVTGQIPETNSENQFRAKSTATNNSAGVEVSDKLDYETTPCYELEVQAQYYSNLLSTFQTLFVTVLDENDETPLFLLPSLFVASPEERDPDFPVVYVQAQDADTPNTPYSTITYSLVQSFLDAANFTINPTTGEIISKIKFDREVKAVYTLQVKAEDGAPSILPGLNGEPNSNTMRVTINVVDINDNSPVFAEMLYTSTIPEDTRVGSEVIRVTATDADSDSNPRYLITANNTAGVFDVGPATGRISIASPLDYETQREYLLQYSANDGLNVATTTIHIQLTNVNDEKPIFRQDVYRADVVEEDATNLPRQLVQVLAKDGDTDAAQLGIKYSLEGTGADSEFTINADDGWISLNKKLDREDRPVWILLVRATDDVGTGLTGYAELEVTIIDINDNLPYFPDSEYRGSVPENSYSGTEVAWTPAPLKAIDLDDPLTYGRITYLIGTGSDIVNDGARFFSIDGSTGRVTVAQGVVLDRETQDMYTLRIRAVDNDDHSVEIDIIIQVLDTNDNSPAFIGGPYTASVRETEPVGSTVFEVPVSDADVGFRNEVQLSITGGNNQNLFEIVTDSVTLIGIIRILNPLDYETMPGPYTLTLQVTDGVNAVSTTTIQITVMDVNDIAPMFLLLPYEVTIVENVDVDSLVYTVTATDGEADEFGRFTFSIDPASDPDGLYTISGPSGSGASRTGMVRTAKGLDREKVAVQELILRATDQGVPPLTGTATLTVTLEDVNDTPPRFAQDYKPMIEENKPTVQFVVTVSAVDPDFSGGPLFNLQVVETSDTGNFTWVNAGVNRLNISTKPISFDYEEQAFYTIPIQMTDLYPNGNTGISNLIVEVEDVNDNPHKGVEKKMLVYSFEGNILDSPIGFVGVDDPDTMEDKTYTPQADLPKKYFTVNSDTGEVTILAGTLADVYKFSLIVDDGGTFSNQTSTITVDVRDIPEEAVRSSGSFRFENVTAEQLIAKPVDGGPSKLDVLKSILAEIIPAKPDNIDIFSVINVPGVANQVDIRYSAHGLPYYSPEKMDGAALANRDRIAEELGVTIGMIKIDMCLLESTCESACTNKLVIDPTPTVVNSPSASFTSITTRTVAWCVCGANFRQPGPCDFDACLNGGTCMETQGGGHKCNCSSGLDGPNCEQTTREFKAGFAHFGTLQQCEETHTSLEFITTAPRGILLYNGPMTPLEGNLPQDFMLIQLSANGQPTLDIDLGSGNLTLTINSNVNLGDGEWHRLDVYRNGKDVEFMLDRCRTATVAEASSSSNIQDTEQCKNMGQTPGDNKFLNMNTPLQLGGIDKSTAFTYPLGITFENSFDGCMKNVDQNGTIYDLQTPGKVSESTAGCSRLACGECNDGKCVGAFNTYVCLCNPGFTGATCKTETSLPVNFALPEPPVGRNGTVVCNPAPGSDVPEGNTEGNCTFTDDTDQVNNNVCFFDVNVAQTFCPEDQILWPDVGQTTVESNLELPVGNATVTCDDSPDISTGMTEVSCNAAGLGTGLIPLLVTCTFMVPNGAVVGNGIYGFPIGMTDVACNTTIIPGLSNACIFQVKVECKKCENGGKYQNKFTCACECPNLYTGLLCSSVECMNDGVANQDDCSCKCTDGWTGSNCKDEVPIVPEDNYPDPPEGVLVEKKVTIEIAVTSVTGCDASNPNNKTSDACTKLVENFKVQVSISYRKLAGFLRVDVSQSELRAGSVIIPHTPVFDYGRMTPAGRALSAGELYAATVADDLAKGTIGDLNVAPTCDKCVKPQDKTDMCKEKNLKCEKGKTLVPDKNGDSCYLVCRANCKAKSDYCNYGTCFQDAEGVMSCRCPQSSEYMYSGVTCNLKVHLTWLYVGCGVGGGLLLIAIIVMISCLVWLCKKVKKLQEVDMEPEERREMRSEIHTVHSNPCYVKDSAATAEDQEDDRR